MKCLLVAGLALMANSASAQVSELFLTSYQDTTTYVVQGGYIVRQFQRTQGDDGPALVVQDTVKCYGQQGGAIGHEYSYAGAMLSGQYTNPSFASCYDGASDGVRNWTVKVSGSTCTVLVGDADWGNMQTAFTPINRCCGITYDPTDGTLWLTKHFGGADKVRHYTATGTLLGEFSVTLQNGGGWGIALDPFDQTLWIPGAYGTQARLDQYTKGGVLLQSISVPGVTTETFGAEFRLTPIVQSYCTAGVTSHGCTATISTTGTPSASAPSGFTLDVDNVEGQKQGLLFYGVSNAGYVISPWGTSSSYLCVKPPTQRTNVQFSGGTNLLCDGQFSLDWNAFRAANPFCLGSPFSAGDHVFAQAWFRDPPSPKSTMLSDAIEFSLAP
jgi:hypothetical protein